MTAEGRAENERLLREELDARPELSCSSVTDDFLPLNGAMLQVCTDWQVKGENELNDHADADYDAALSPSLLPLTPKSSRSVPPGEQLSRFAIHVSSHLGARKGPSGRDRMVHQAGIMESYHTVWFEMHEDLLASLGIDRASEKAH
ncbi:MAG: hypothetical protein R2706_03915 [Acidimicrobiales bacterium]